MQILSFDVRATIYREIDGEMLLNWKIIDLLCNTIDSIFLSTYYIDRREKCVELILTLLNVTTKIEIQSLNLASILDYWSLDSRKSICGLVTSRVS